MNHNLLLLKAIKLGFIVDYTGEHDKYVLLCEIQRWLRKKHEIYVHVLPFNDEELNQILWENVILDIKDEWNSFSDHTFHHSYEEAFEAGILEGLKLIKI